jgi:hypothetical protein
MAGLYYSASTLAGKAVWRVRVTPLYTSESIAEISASACQGAKNSASGNILQGGNMNGVTRPPC